MHRVLLPLFLDKRAKAVSLSSGGKWAYKHRGVEFFRRVVNIYRSYTFLTVETNKL